MAMNIDDYLKIKELNTKREKEEVVEKPVEQPTVEVDKPEPDEKEDKRPPVEEIDINGVKVPLTELMDLYNSNSNLTERQKEIKLREMENSKAIELYEFMQENPEIANKLIEYAGTMTDTSFIDPSRKAQNKELEALRENQRVLEARLLKSQGVKFNQYEVLDIARKENISVEDAIKKANPVREEGESQTVNIKELTEQIRKDILEELKGNVGVTTIGKQTGSFTSVKGHGLSADEIKIAKQFGLTPEEYAKYK